MRHPGLFAFLLGAAACASAGGSGTVAVPALELATIPEYRAIQDCARRSPSLPCRETVSPPPSELESRLQTTTAAAWGSGDRWQIAYRAPDDSVTGVTVGGGIQLPMSRLAGTRLWTLSLRFPGVDHAVISLYLQIRRNGSSLLDTTSIRGWRGPLAPRASREATRLAGTLRVDSLWSDALQARRGLTIYLPPSRGPGALPVVYFADGQNVDDYARIIDPLVANGALPPVALVGVWGSSGSPTGGPARGPAQDLRTIEYHAGVEEVPGADSAFVVARYRGHRIFFTEEVRRWAEDALGVSRERHWRAVQGTSSGANYVLILGRERSDLYGMVIANSNGGSDALMPPAGGWSGAARHYLTAGVLEPVLVPTLRALGDTLDAHGIPVRVDIYPGGHDFTVWRESLQRALAWWLRGR